MVIKRQARKCQTVETRMEVADVREVQLRKKGGRMKKARMHERAKRR